MFPRGAVDIEKSPINRKILEGSLYAIGKIEEKDYFQFPEDIQKEGIDSMMCLPLRAEKRVLGVFCVYSNVSYYFSKKDIHFFTLMVDLTALAIENLKSDLNKAWFLQKAAHQLRSPLNAVLSMLKVMRKEYLGPLQKEQKETLTRCERRIEMLEVLIEDLLKLGLDRAEADGRDLYPVDIKTLVRGYINLYKSHASEKNLELKFEIAESVPKIMADDKLLDELCTNLISNAIKYTPPGGRIDVALVFEDPETIRFEVSDTGIGIADEDIPRLFSEFFRADNAKTHEEEGTGLGLVIVKEILDRLRGTISVKSKVGEGSRFTCLLPIL
ncbi:MAG: GAF domain-containing sensor histidine kinase [Pseudomonadota bacterium]